MYFRTAAEVRPTASLSPHSLANKVEIKADSPSYQWLMGELARGYDYICCANMEDFRRHPKALTRQGQVKTGGMRHEKDDRNRIDDRSRYVLGWSNEEKIRALEAQLEDRQAEGDALLSRLGKIDDALKGLDKQQAALHELLRPTEFSLIDWPQPVAQIHQLQQEKLELEQSSDTLRTLNASLKTVTEQLKESNQKLPFGQIEVFLRAFKAEIAPV